MAFMISYKTMDEKLDEMRELVRRTRLETDVLVESNNELSMYWNSEAASEYIKKTSQDLTFIRLVLMGMSVKITQIKDLMKKADDSERRVYALMGGK